MSEAAGPQAPRLKKALRFRDLALFYVVSGLSVRWCATAAAAGPSSLVVWLMALIGFFLPLAASVVELSSRYPQEGGLYVWAREAFGDFAGFISAWMYWMSNLPFFPSILYFGAGSLLVAAGRRGEALSSNPTYFMLFAVLWLTVITVINIVGLDAGKWLNNFASLGGFIPILVLITLAAFSFARFGSVTHFTGSSCVPHASWKNAVFWSTIFFAYGGCEAGSFMGEEIVEPRRTIPRAMFAGGLVLALGYILGTASLLVAVPASSLDGVYGFMHGVQALCTRLGLPWLVSAMAALLALNAIGGAASFLSSTSRLPFVAGIDRYLPPVFGRVHPRFRTPWVAIATYGAAGALVAVLGQAGTTVRGAYDVLISMSIVTYFLPYLLLFASMWRLQSLPVAPDTARVPGGRPMAYAVAIVGFLSTSATIVLSVIPAADEPNKSAAVLKVLLSTAILLAAGTGLYLFAKRKRQTRKARA